MDLGTNQHLQENCTSLEFPCTEIKYLAEKGTSIIFSPTAICKMGFYWHLCCSSDFVSTRQLGNQHFNVNSHYHCFEILSVLRGMSMPYPKMEETKKKKYVQQEKKDKYKDGGLFCH